MDIIAFDRIKKKLKKVPKDIIKRLMRWALYVETLGLLETRKIPGIHDEPLKGDWKGYRSVRLGNKWRVIYKTKIDGTIYIVILEEITPHAY